MVNSLKAESAGTLILGLEKATFHLNMKRHTNFTSAI